MEEEKYKKTFMVEKENKLLCLNDQSGFTLIEILVALFIVVLVYGSLSLGTDSASAQRDYLDQSMELVERGIRFASDEAILRGSFVRIRFFLDEEKPYFKIEYGPKTGFVLPDFEQVSDYDRLSSKEKEQWDEKIKNIDKNFIAVEDLDKDLTTFPSDVTILGIATSLRDNLSVTGDPAFYFYPTGEKDDFFLAIGGAEEVATLEAGPFTTETEKKYFTLIISKDAEDQEAALLDAQESTLKEIYENWKKDN